MAKGKDPSHLAHLQQKAMSCFDKGDLAGTVAACQRYLKADARDPNITSLLAIARYEQGFHAAALDMMQRATALAPRDIGLRFNYAKMLAECGRAAEAEPVLRACLQEAPTFDPALNTLGIVVLAQGRPREAAEAFEAATRLAPTNHEYLANLAASLQQMHARPAALVALARAAELAPHECDLQINLGKAHFNNGDPLASLRHYAAAQELQPDSLAARTGALVTRLSISDWSNFDRECATISSALTRGPEANRSGVSPYLTTLISSDPAVCLAAARAASNQHRLPKSAKPQSFRAVPDARKRLRIAYVSADYREHATSYLIAEAIELHDRASIEPIAISYGPAETSPMRSRMEAAFEQFIDVSDLTPPRIAARMRELHIDVAVDLQGFNQFNRMEIFAHRAAPIQAIYLGWPGTSGADYYDYILADADVIPAENRQHFSEKVVWLPTCYQPNDRQRRIADTPPTRAECDLPDEGLVLACLNNPFKILPDMFDVWMRILRQLPGSVLWLLGSSPLLKDNLRREAESRGVAGERLRFAPNVPNAVHLARHAHIDLVLDTLPYNAHTTASDALWMGVPVLTCTGTSFAGRVATSLLRSCGGDDLITTSIAEYERRALDLAANPARLEELGRLVEKAARGGHPPFDTPRLTRGLEAAYAAMAARRCRGEPPAHLDLRHVEPPG